MKFLILIFSLTLFISANSANAGIYTWTDRDGVLHIVDNVHKIPPHERRKLQLDDSVPIKKKTTVDMPREIQKTIPQPSVKRKVDELFGDKPLRWWKMTFSAKRKDIKDINETITEKERFIDTFNYNSRFGTIQKKADIERYNLFTREIPNDKTKRKKLTDELEILVRKARNAGVPKSIRNL